MDGKRQEDILCWCDSGLLYKDCHLNRDKKPPVTLQEIKVATDKVTSKKYCLHPQASGHTCSKGIIRAHTIQRSGGLSRIARNGHVVTCMPPDMMTVLKSRDVSVKAREIGIKDASTFTGFCGRHDNEVFKPIESQPFQSNPQHTFLLAYRAICREYFAKKMNYDLLPFFRTLDRGRPFPEQLQMQQTINAWSIGTSKGLKELQHYKSRYDAILMTGDFSEVQYYVIRLQNTPDFLCSASTQPEYDFLGKKLQTFDRHKVDLLLEQITFSIIATDNGGAIVFTWLDNSPATEKLITSLHSISDDLLPHAITRFAFEYFENLYSSPVWWESLEEHARQKLIYRQLPETHPQRKYTPDPLRDDGLRVVSWSVAARETNLHL